MMRIAVFSKERLFLDALSGLLDRRASLQVVARETNPKDLISSAKKASAQLLIVDTEKLDVDEVQFLLGARAVGDFFMAMIGEKDSDNSADAVISRSSSADDLYESVSALSSRVPAVVSREGKRAYGKGDDLTRREYEVAEFVARGMSNRTIAEVSDLHEQSVKNLVSVIMRKLKCENRTQIALKLINAEVELPTD
jgi:hypothetical protein